ncbi:MAG: hypothetical protein ABSH13_04705 [Candidatus Acidiferrum sp.]|jgi:hypothetical protein
MSFGETREARISGVLAAALAIFLLAGHATPAASLPSIAEPAETRAVANPALDSVCQTIVDANDKLYTTSFHMYMTQTSPGIENGKPMKSEVVFVGGPRRYVWYDGKWTDSPFSTADLKEMEERNLKNAKNESCRYLRDEPVNGESAAVYTEHGESEHGKDDSQIWISKSKGLILRMETDLDTGGGANGKSHLSVRYEYGNVQAPKL